MDGALSSLDTDLGPHVFLKAGELHCTPVPTLITTVLGSCVAVCLWDSLQRIGGMNHFLLPYSSGVPGIDPRYGDAAIDRLIKRMAALGSRPANIEAKIFGGAEVLGYRDTHGNVGARNIAVTLSQLADRHIPITARRIGGKQGLVIRLATDTGGVLVRAIAN